MKPRAWAAVLLPCAGLVIPPLLWALNTQIGLIIPDPECRSGFHFGALSSFSATALALAAGYLSWRARKGEFARSAAPRSGYAASFDFVAMLGGLTGLVFAFAMMLHGTSSLLLSGCER